MMAPDIESLPRVLAPGRARPPNAPPADDADLALLLITTWALRSGRSLRPVPVHALTIEELETFWADDQLTDDGLASGAHRRGDHGP
ncbi:hypothetical protein EBO15_20670 [Actinomadura harenae]|uniref:Uncharacterized protein n=2 Tax=Actinomadura harenae TaxID=2483351 RepID=A0A3M2LYR0_9ACTN|nr:hypothetical protein EBO15_20670 [Actinomadura harenae]